jgi:uncharacterized protein YfaS (alpha-2-macroglobulin family)
MMGELSASLVQGGQTIDRLQVRLATRDGGWTRAHSLRLPLTAASTPLTLPPDARDIELRVESTGADLLRGSLDDLIEYPWGCVEQTASRLLPLSLAFAPINAADPRHGERLRLTLQNNRLRLVQMAGPNARFSWWGEGAEDAFMTAYAYYADYHASRALGLSLPDEHWQRVLEAYAEHATTTPLLQRVLILDFAQAMKLPVQSLLAGVLGELAVAKAVPATSSDSALNSLILTAPDSALGLAAARVLAARLAPVAQVELPAGFAAGVVEAERRLAQSPLPFAEGVLRYRATADPVATRALFERLAPEQATLERALMLTWLAGSLSTAADAPVVAPTGWTAVVQPSGETRWRWDGAGVPATLDFASAPIDASALLTYESTAPLKSMLPVTIQRRLWQLVPGEDAFQFLAQAVAADAELQSDALYLDEIVVTGDAEKPLRYGLIEVPLPPGADVERTTWGISVIGLSGEDGMQLEKARHEPGELNYAVPIDTLAGEVRFSHLVRFSQKGRFTLPPARYSRMYAPEQQAFETEPALGEVEVR